MAATVCEAVEFGWGPALLERALEGEVSLVGAVQLAEALTGQRADRGTALALLDGSARVDLLRVWERLEGMVAGRKQLALAAVVDATTELGLSPEDARHEVAAALRLAPVTASDRTRVAVELRDRLPGTMRLLCAGEISWRQAANVADGVRDLPDDVALAVEARVLDRMPHQTAAETRRAVADAVVRVDPAAAEARAEKAHRGRRIERLDQPDSMRSWWFPVPADVEHDMWSAVTNRAVAVKAARAAAGLDEIGIDALRVDVVRDAILGLTGPPPICPGCSDAVAPGADGTSQTVGTSHAIGTSHTIGPSRHSGRPLPKCSCGGKQVAAVVVDLPTALGLTDNPGVIPGYGTVPGPMARAMAADRDWVRWTTDPGTRQVIDRGADTYRPSDKMLAFVAARDRTCGFPGCHRRAQECDCDHVVRYGRPDGKTVTINLGPLCRQHHNAKTHGRWRLHNQPRTGLKTWTSPLGKTYVKGTDPPLA